MTHFTYSTYFTNLLQCFSLVDPALLQKAGED